ncbi:PASTA domain-containing protein [Schnuerera sp. xch1]|uniref:penicillin-binding transpeptidase domain-containing protein n=1 Tax=Schnuerera sp. xch1 TaxID=2874283 RepID=UPI001CC18E65|nr:penicillin-binding transpeptidase domain-containing protein [Schnuerera sp. xch1]MBZ2173670.1 PASTA domain-containing protein [Schnuerera sp. xch1]
MAAPSNASKKRLLFAFTIILVIVLGLIMRLGYIQIVTGEELKKGALEQWTKGIDIKAKRGTIYDRNGKELAISVSSHTVWASPANIDDPDSTAKKVAEVLNMDESVVYEKITKKTNVEKIKQWISMEETKELRRLNIPGIEIVEDNKRFYPYEDFASYILGFTDIDNNGLYGIEKTYDKYLSGSPGRWVKTEDARGVQMPYDGEKVYEAEEGLNVVLTIDETIQHFTEKIAMETLTKTKAKNVSIVMMEPNTGDILAMSSLPQYDPNNPREPLDEAKKAEWENLLQEKLQKEWYNMWRNFAINDSYEPGSTFKSVVTAAALEEGVVDVDTNFYCNGFVRDIPGGVIKCSRWYNPHGAQTLKEGLENSCNVVFVNVGRKLGKEKLYEYIKAFGFGQQTGIELTGEQGGIIPVNTDVIKEINLATMSFGHGIAVTPIQLVNAISAIANGGELMTPRIVSKLVDNEGNVVISNEPEVKRRAISKSTSDTMLKLMEGVVSDGTGSNAYVPGFRVAGKTGTAQKIIDGRYAPGKYIGSFVAIAPADDPKIALLVIVDEPEGIYYGGSVAAPAARDLIQETLTYLEVEPKFTEEEKEEYENTVVVPDVRNMNIQKAGKILTDSGFKYTTESYNINEKSMIIEQFPLPGTEVTKGSIIDLYLDGDYKDENKIIVPELKGKSKDDVTMILDGLGLTYEFKGEGTVTNQKPKAGIEVDINSKIEVEFSDTED